MTYQAFCEEFAEVLEAPKDTMTDDFNLERNSAWDSLAFISTIALIDKYYNIIIDSETLQTVKTFGDLSSLLFKKAA